MIRTSSLIHHGFRWTFLSLLLLLTACGGGGGGTIFDGGGGGSTPDTETFAYIANNNGAISIMAVDVAQATLLYRGYEKVSTSGLNGIAMHPSEKFLYALATGAPGSVHGYAIDASTGGLTAINDLPTDDNNPGEILVNPSGTALYVTNRTSDKVSQYIVNSTVGVLGTLGAALSTGQNPVDIKLHPNGKLLFTVNRDDQSVWVFPVNSDGSLQAGHSVYSGTGNGVTSIAFDDDGTHAYLTVINSGSNGFVRTLSVDTTTGALTQIDSVGAGDAPEDVKVDATGTHAYVSNFNSDTIMVYDIDQGTGSLTWVQTASISNGHPDKIGIEPDGEYLYVNNTNLNQVSVFAIAAGTGQLTLMDHYRTRSAARGTVLKTGTGTVTHVAKYLFAPDTTSMVQTFPLDATTGALGTATGTTAGTRPMNVAVHPNGQYVYVVNQGSNDIYSYSINPDTGALSGNGTNSIGGFMDMVLTRLAIDPNGHFLYALDSRNILDQQGRVFLFDIGSDGKLTYSTQNPTTGYTIDFNPENFLIDPTGEYLYVVCSRGDEIDWFQISPTTGALVSKQTFSGNWTNGSPGGRPLSMAIHPNGRWAYITAQEDNELWKYYLTDSNGGFTSQQSSAIANNTEHVAVHPSGAYVYMTDSAGNFMKYSVDTTTGSLTYDNMLSPGVGTFFWISVAPDGRHLYALNSTGVGRFSIDPNNGDLTYVDLTSTSSVLSQFGSLTLYNTTQ